MGKNPDDGVGIGKTIDEAWNDLESSGNCVFFKNTSFYSLTQVKVKLSIDNSKTIVKKETK
jgi:hypothetical protein